MDAGAGDVRGRAEYDLAEEMESHVQMHADDNVALGMSPREARRQAILSLGGVEQAKQAVRERRGLPWLETLGQDVGYGLRGLRRSPGFALVTVLTLALGIGANTALFSIVDSVLLHPLPYLHANELVTVHASKANFATGSISFPNFRDWQRDNHTLAGLEISRETRFSLTGMGETERLRGDYVSSGFFSLLGVKPVLGRLFAPGEDEIGRGPIALIGAGLWERKFGSRPDVIGNAIKLDGRDFTIVGVLPADFDLSVYSFRAGDVYLPIGQWQTQALRNRFAGLGLHGIARLKPGVTLEKAQEDMVGVSDRLAAAYPEDDHGIRAKLIPLQESMVGRVQPVLLVLMGAVGFVLLIACVNVANLLLARSNGRAQEFAVRSALGAGRGRIVRQLLTESTLLALTGGGLGLVLAHWGMRAAMTIVPERLPGASEVHLSGTVLAFTLAVSLGVGVLFGLLPAWRISRQNLQETLKDGGRGIGGRRHRGQGALVIFEMAMTLVLLTGAGLMIRSMVVLSRVNPGFDPAGVASFSLAAPPGMASATPDGVRAYLREVNRRVAQVPGVEGATLFQGGLPMSGSDDEQFFWLEGEPKPANMNDMHWALGYTVEPDYLKVMGISLLRGRFFTDEDTEHSPLVVVIDEALARKYFGDQNPVGKQISLDGQEQKATVIGEVRHVMQWRLDNDANFALRAQMYLAFRQLPDSAMSLRDDLRGDVVVRARPGVTTVMDGIRQTLREMNREQVVYDEATLKQFMSDSLAARRFSMILLGLFAGLALVLASVGMYGVIAYLVSQRTHEIGIRMALGADRADVLRWVLGQGGRLAVIGAAVGLAGALVLAQVMARLSMTYGVLTYDPWTLAGVTGLLMLVALVACYVPARKAMRIDPMQALRVDQG